MSQRGNRKHFDVIVIGSGLAGLNYCLELIKLRPQTRIALISKNKLHESNSHYAQGGIAAVAHPEDSLQQHIQDTLAAGDYFGDKQAIENIISAAPETIKQLTNYGVQFDKADQEFHLSQEGGHLKRRIHHVGDQTGKAIVAKLTEQIAAQKNIFLFEFHTAVNLITQNKKHLPNYYGETIGAYILEETSGLIHTFIAPIVVLATGGAGKTYRYTSNPDVATGDGVAMAHRAGARIGNMEFYQFHPTLLYHPQLNNFLISEAMRGEGAYLRLPDTEERFMQRYAPEQMELATRDVVARAIFNEIENSAHNFVYLDIRHRPKEFLQQRFPNIYQTLFNLGIDISKDMIPVVPAAHYMCGGILADINGQTDLQRLYAIGETAFTGFHGANRLASNSLLETCVMGSNAAKHSLAWLDAALKINNEISDWDSQGVIDLRRASQINAHWRGLRGEMTSYGGIVRTEAGLRDLLELICARKQMIEDYYWKHRVTRDLIELRNIVTVAELIVDAALKRRESRGGHYREDYPKHHAKSVNHL